MSRILIPIAYPDNLPRGIVNAFAKELQAGLRARIGKMVDAGVVAEGVLLVGTPLLHYETGNATKARVKGQR